MPSKNENAIQSEFDANEQQGEELNFDELEAKLQSQLEEELGEIEFLAEERAKIGSPDNLGNVIMDVVWEQFLNQVAVTAGEDFIKENRGLHLDLRNEAHIQTTENFANGKIATHNTKIDYQKRYDDWQKNFQKNPDIEHKTSNYKYNKKQQVWEKYDARSGSWKKVLKRDARSDFDKNRPAGKNTENTNVDHVISAAEIIRDPATNAHLSREEQIAFANSKKNLNLMDSAANQSKGDSTMSEFLDSERDGKKPGERFDIDEEALRKKDAEAREEYEKLKREGEKRSIEAGKKSQKEEAFRMGKSAIRAVIMQLLTELVREIFSKLVKWFKSEKKKLDTLLESLKEAIQSFIEKMKQHLINAGKTLFTTIATAIVGPVVGMIKKVWMILKQGWNSLKEAIEYIKNPANKGKPISILMMEVGKIIIAGLTGAGALVLGEVIEKSLMAIPIFAVEIPLLGSLANILGIFFGAVVAGIVGALAINFLDNLIAKRKEREVQAAKIEKQNQVISAQHKIQIVKEVQLEQDKDKVCTGVLERHKEAHLLMKDAYGNIMEDFVEDSFNLAKHHKIDEEDVVIHKKIDKISDDLDDLLSTSNEGV